MKNSESPKARAAQQPAEPSKNSKHLSSEKTQGGQDSNHPQTSSFLSLFPRPDLEPTLDAGLGKQVKDAWNENFKDSTLAFAGLSAKSPGFDHEQAERAGNDYACRIYAHFTLKDAGEIRVFLGSIPYPDKNGEFVLGGNRYIFPVYLRTSTQYQKLQERLLKTEASVSTDKDATADVDLKEDERKTGNLHVVLIHELLEQGLKRRLNLVLKTLQNGPWNDNPQVLGASLRRWLNRGERSSLYGFIYKYGNWIDVENPLARILRRKELTFYGFGGEHPDSTRGYGIRDVDDDDIYRICPVVTPQGHKIGMRLTLARRSKIDLEKKSLLAPDQIEPGDSLSDAASLIPFIEHDDVSRALMGANMMKQTLPLERPDAPWIQTGWERELAKYAEIPEDLKANGILSLGKNLLTAYLPWGLETFEDGIVVSESAASALTSRGEKTFWFSQDKETWREGDYCHTEITMSNPRVPEGDKSRLDEEGIIAVGTNVKPGDVLVSALLKRFKDIHKTRTLDVILSDDLIEGLSKKGPEEVRDVSLRVPHNFEGRVIEVIDLKSPSTPALPPGITRRIGVRIQCKEALKVGDKIISRHGAKGVVVWILADKDMPHLKTDISFCSAAECPLKDPHRHIQVILNPLGVTGRLNLGQLYETTLAKAAERGNQAFIVKPFVNDWNLDHLAETLVSQGFPEDGKEQLYVLEKGSEQPLRYRSLVGPQYFLKLEHMAEKKSQGRAVGKPYDYTLRDNQPRQGKRVRGDKILGSGQRVGEMETWALAGHAAWNLLDDLLNVKSDDRRLLKRVDDADFKWDESRRPQAFVNLILVFRSLALDLRLMNASEDVTEKFLENPEGEIFDKAIFTFAKPDQVKEWGRGGEVTSINLYGQIKSKDEEGLYSDPAGLLSREIFDSTKPWQMGRITLVKPVLHPLIQYSKATYDPNDYLLEHIAVLPASFRSERLGFYKNFQDDLNVLYRNVMIQNTRLKKLIDGKKMDQAQLDQAQKRLYNAIRNLFLGGNVYGKSRRGLMKVLEGKKGLVRGHLAGKRADYSGRAVIVGDPSMPLDEAGLPETIWSGLFPNPDRSEKPIILLNRQPTLHRYGIQAFRASHHERGNVIVLNPFICRPFNADFDGDTIAIHVPVKQDAIKERERLLPTHNLLSQANGKMVLGFEKDIAIAAAYLTYHPEVKTDEEIPLTTEEELPLDGRDFWEKETFKGVETTVGRLLLRRFFGEVSISNRSMNQDRWMDALEKLTKLAARKDPSMMERFTREISRVFARILKGSGLSLSLKDFRTFSDSQRKEESPSLLWLMSETGRYGEDLEGQITQKRGRMRRPGRDSLTESIESNLLDGHTEEDYFRSAHGARAGLVDKGLITAASGYLLRDWIYLFQHLYIVQEDCGSSQGLDVAQVDEIEILNTRFDVKGELIKKVEEGLQFRSPWTCQAKDHVGHAGICQKCYGLDPATGDLPAIGLPVGILAAQALGERVSQETLKSFHTGGIAHEERKGLALVEYLREAFPAKVRDPATASKKVHEIFEQFPRGSRPGLIHFEVILRGYKPKENQNDFLSGLAYSQGIGKLIDSIMGSNIDDLHSVVGRIVSGRLIHISQKG